MSHEHVEIGDAEYAEMLMRMQERWDAAIEIARTRDHQACVRCMQMGALIGQIVAVEMMIEAAPVTPELHAGLQVMYARRDQLTGHRPESRVVQ